MSRSFTSFFDRNENLRINGDVNIFTGNVAHQENDKSFVHVTQRVQATNAQSRAFKQGFKILCNNTAPSSRYGYSHSFTGPRCHKGTRIAVQDHIFRWLNDPNGEIAMWMNGPVGIGKSAIAQTVSHLAAEQGQLSSAFFFFRSDNTRNDSKHLIPSLAYEMTQQIPRTVDSVCQTIATNPLIFSSHLDRQVNDVLLQPLRFPHQSPSERPMLIVIDGLDECLDTNIQQKIVQLFITSLLSASAEIIPHKLLIVSRPESHIESAFSASDVSPHVKHLTLAMWDTEDDIEIFLRDKLAEIKDTHPLKHYLPKLWPDGDSFRKLRQRSLGSFAYASSVIRFIGSHKNNPDNALQDILSLEPRRAAAAFADLDSLYKHILSSLDPDICFTVLKALCLYIYSGENAIRYLTVALSEEQSVIDLALIHVSSLIYCAEKRFLHFYHESFREFLRDKGRSGEYHIFSPNITSAVATALSNIWLHPVNSRPTYFWFQVIGKRICDPNRFPEHILVDIEILRTLIATKLSASMFSVEKDSLSHALHAVGRFFESIQYQSIHSNSPHRPVFSEAFNVVCMFLRQQLNDSFQGLATLSDILDIIVTDFPNYNENMTPEDPGLNILYRLATKAREPMDFLCRLFPEVDCLGVYSGILEKYMALPPESRQSDASRRSSYSSTYRAITLNELYIIVLGTQSAMVPKLCHQLEQLVLDGRKAFSGIPSQHLTPEACIYRVLYGPRLSVADGGQPFMKTDNIGLPYWQQLQCEVVEKTSYYIREVHAKWDIPYISEDVEALYRL